LLQN
jgi:hypothetical protein